MMYKVSRIQRVIDGQSSFEHCSLMVSDLEKLRRSIDADEVNFVYETID